MGGGEDCKLEADHIAITNCRTTKVKDFVGLIFTAWITSATLGCLNAAIKRDVSKILVVVVFVLIILVILRAFFFVFQTQKTQRSNTLLYQERFLHLQEEEKQTKEDDYSSPPIKQWNLKLLSGLTIGVVLCSIPWLVVNMTDLRTQLNASPLEHSLPLCIYTVSFYVLAFVCIYMKYRDFMTGTGLGKQSVANSFTSKSPVQTKREFKKMSDEEDLVSNMEREDNYGTFGM